MYKVHGTKKKLSEKRAGILDTLLENIHSCKHEALSSKLLPEPHGQIRYNLYDFRELHDVHCNY